MNPDSLFSHRNSTKVILTVGLISLVLAEVAAYLTPQTGYEVSLYASTPSIVFVLLIVAIVGGICLLCQQVLSGEYRRSRIWLAGFALLLLARLLILYLPYIRGYYSWMGDNSTHLGLAAEIVAKGFVDPKNFYPITHIYLAQIQLVTALPIDFIVNHSTALLSVLFVLVVYAFARMVFDDERSVILTIAAVGAVIFTGYEVYLMPNGWSCLFLPLAVYFIVRSMDSGERLSFRVLALLTVIVFPFFHPFSTLMMIFVLVLFVLITLASAKVPLFRGLLPSGYRFLVPGSLGRFNNMPAFFLGIGVSIWILWIVSFRRFNSNIRNLADALMTSDTFDAVGAMAVQADKMDFDVFDIVVLLIKDYGHQLVFIATFLLGGGLFLRYRRTFPRADRLFLILVLPLAFALLFLVYLAGLMPGLDSINAQRVPAFIFLFAPVISGIFFAHTLSKKRAGLTVLCILMLIAAPLFSLFAVYPSPYNHRATPDITEMDVKGMEWSFRNKDPDVPYTYIMSPPFRFADIVLGRTERDRRSDIDHVMKIPDHFNYRQNLYLGESFTNTSFALLTEFDRILYDTAYEKVGRFRSADFERLQADPTVHRVYSNSESNAYIIRAGAV